MRWYGGLVALLLGSCVPTLTGAPCRVDENCPTRQYCDGTTGTCQPGPPPDTRVVQLLVAAPAGILPLGTAFQATATAVLQSGAEQDVTAAVTWSTGNDRVALVSNATGSAGAVLAVGTGEVDVTATLDQNVGSVHLVVTDAELLALVVTVDRPVVAPRSDVACSAVGFFTDGTHADLTTLVDWTSTEPDVVSVSTAPGSVGLLTALGPGDARLRAGYQKLSGYTDLSVTDATLTELSVAPLAPQVSVGTHIALQATGLFSDGTAQPVTTNVQWTVADPALAFFSPSTPGNVEGFSAGSTVVQAQAGASIAEAPLLVSAAPVVALEIAPALPDPMGIGGAVSFTAWATFADQGVEPVGDQAAWSSTVPEVLAVLAASGRASAVDAGVADVQASFAPLSAASTQAVLAAEPVELLVWPPTAPLPVGLPGLLAAERVLADGSVEEVSDEAGWISSCPAHVEVSTGARGGALAARSTATCVATAQLGGLSGTASVTASPQGVQSLQTAPGRVALGVGGRFALTATAVLDDGTVRDVTALAAWTSSATGMVAVGNGSEAGRGLAADAGTAQLTARFGNATAISAVTVSPGAPLLEIWPPLVHLHVRTQRPLRATAVWPAGDSLDVTPWTVFGSSDATVARAANAAGIRGQLTGFRAGTASVSAAWGPLSTQASVTVAAATVGALAIAGPSSLPAGRMAKYLATAQFSDGSDQDITAQAAWTASPSRAVRVRGTGPDRGTAVGLGEGVGEVRALFAGIAGSAPLTVGPGGVQSLAVQGPAGPLPAGVQVQLGAVGTFSGGLEQDVTGDAVWSSSSTTVAVVSNGPGAGLLTTPQPGTALITVRFGGVQTSVAVQVSAATLTGLAILPAAPTAPLGLELPLRAWGTFSDGRQLDLTRQARWSSSDTARLAVSNGERTRGMAMALIEGTNVVSVSVARPDSSLVSAAAAFIGSAP